MSTFKKIASEREKRNEQLYKMEDTYEVFTPVCGKHPGIRKELLDSKQKEKLGLSKTELAWRCPVDGEVTEAHSSIDMQTHGMSLENNTPEKKHTIVKDGFDNIDSIEADKSRKIR